MWQLRFVSVHEDGQHLVVSSPDFEDEAFLLPLTDELRDAVAAPVATPARPAPTFGEQLTPREIQSRVRAGESVEALAQASGLPPGRIERYAGPVLSERAHVAEEARAARPAGQADDVSRTLAEIVDPRLAELHADPDTVSWDSWRRDDGVWMLQLGYDSEGDRHSAEWTWDPARRQLRSYGAAARALMAPPQVEPAEPVAGGRPASPEANATGLRVVPPRSATASAPSEAEAEAQSIGAHPSGRAKKKPDPAAGTDPADPAGKRATVPSWDDIMFGIRRPDEAT